MSHKVESITESDIEALHELFSHAGDFVTARTLSDYWLYARLFASTCLCVRDDSGRLSAGLIAFRDQTPGRSEIYVQDVAVASGSRRRGLGDALLMELESRADQLGVGRIWLTSEAENEDAIRLWERRGFKNESADYLEGGLWVTKDLKGPGRDRVVFETHRQLHVTPQFLR